MKRTLMLIVGAVAIVGASASMWRWQSHFGFHVAGHRMGESASDFAKIEAQRYRINLADCEHIGYPGKRELCDYLLKLSQEPLPPGTVTYSAGGWFDDAFPDEGGAKLSAPGLPDIVATWQVTFRDGRLSDVEFYPPMKYIAWLRQSYGTPEQSQHPPTKQERTRGAFVGQIDRDSVWTIPSQGRGNVIIRVTEAIAGGAVQSAEVNISLCSPCSEGAASQAKYNLYYPYDSIHRQMIGSAARLPRDVVSNLRPRYKGCSTDTLIQNVSQSQAAMPDCSAVVLSNGSIALWNWEIPDSVDPTEGEQVAPAIRYIGELAEKYKVPMGGAWYQDERAKSGLMWCSDKIKQSPNGGVTDDWTCPNPVVTNQGQPIPMPVPRAEIEAAVAQNDTAGVMLKLKPTVAHVFGSDLAVFDAHSDGAASVVIKGDELVFQGCSISDKCSRSAAFCVDLSNGRGAGAIGDDEHVQTYNGDYQSEQELPTGLKQWMSGYAVQ